MSADVVVIAVGNPYRRDDAAGLEVLRRLRRRGAPVRMLESTGEPTDLLDAWDGARLAVVVDAVRSGALPGTLHRVVAAPGVHHPKPVASGHALDFEHALGLGAVLARLPSRLVLIGVEVAETGDGVGLSGAVAAAIDAAVEAVLDELEGDVPEVA